jgi:hypothetical protein
LEAWHKYQKWCAQYGTSDVFSDIMMHNRVDRWNLDQGVAMLGNDGHGFGGTHLYDRVVMDWIVQLRHSQEGGGKAFSEVRYPDYKVPQRDTHERFGLAWKMKGLYESFYTGDGGDDTADLATLATALDNMQKHFTFSAATREGEELKPTHILPFIALIIAEDPSSELQELIDEADLADTNQDHVTVEEMVGIVSGILGSDERVGVGEGDIRKAILTYSGLEGTDGSTLTRRHLTAAFMHYAKMIGGATTLNRTYDTRLNVAQQLNVVQGVDVNRIAVGLQTEDGYKLYLNILQDLSANTSKSKISNLTLAKEWNRRTNLLLVDAGDDDDKVCVVKRTYGYINASSVRDHEGRLDTRQLQLANISTIKEALIDVHRRKKNLQQEVQSMTVQQNGGAAATASMFASGSIHTSSVVDRVEPSALDRRSLTREGSVKSRLLEVPNHRVKDVCYFCLLGHTFDDTDGDPEALDVEQCYATTSIDGNRVFLNGHSARATKIDKKTISCPNYEMPSVAVAALVKKHRTNTILRARRAGKQKQTTVK